MEKIKLKFSPEIGEILSKDDLKNIFGGIGSGIDTGDDTGSNDGKSICSTTCRHNAQGVLSVGIMCKGGCRAVDEVSVTCIDTQVTKYCPPYDKTVEA